MADIHYTLGSKRLGAHIFDVTCEIDKPDPEGQAVSIPAWIPGSYLVRDFARHVLSMSARDEHGTPVAVKKIDKSTWRARPCETKLIFEYEVYAHDLSVRGAHLDTTHGFFNGTSVFLLVHGQDHQPVQVTLNQPDQTTDWRVATTLNRLEGEAYGFGRFSAQDYDELVDHPVEMGCFQLVEFEACGVPHAMALTGRCSFDADRLARDLKKVCETQIRFFGEPAPMDQYLFLTTVLGDGYGGLEHRSSTALVCSRADLPQPHHTGVTDNYRQFLGLCSHEYFHTWNVKRIKPAAFSPYTLDAENYTELLWVFEGITSYYDDLMLVRSGLITPTSYLRLLEKTVTRVWSTPGRHRQSLAESSFDAWVKLYKPDDNSVNAGISYYTKGALLALTLDMEIRSRSKGACSLDDVMRAAWERYGIQGMPEAGFEELVAEVCDLDLQSFFDEGVRTTKDPDLGSAFSYVGISFDLKQEKKSPKDVPPDKPTLGVRTKLVAGALAVASVLEGSAAQEAGVSAGDELVALDGIRLTTRSYRKLLRSYAVGARVELTCFRRDELMTFNVKLESTPSTACCLGFDKDASADVLAQRAAWLDVD
ncbi:MAG: PDZ domain-containing protein [Pseudomonadota bacterium]